MTFKTAKRFCQPWAMGTWIGFFSAVVDTPFWESVILIVGTLVVLGVVYMEWK